MLINFFLSIIIVYSVIFLIFMIRYFRIKEKILLKELYTNLEDQINTINSILNMIDNQIVVNTSYLLREEITLNKIYNPINIDEDSAKIASEVYESIDPKFIINMEKVNHIYNKNFWMTYIVKQTTMSILKFYDISKKG